MHADHGTSDFDPELIGLRSLRTLQLLEWRVPLSDPAHAALRLPQSLIRWCASLCFNTHRVTSVPLRRRIALCGIKSERPKLCPLANQRSARDASSIPTPTAFSWARGVRSTAELVPAANPKDCLESGLAQSRRQANATSGDGLCRATCERQPTLCSATLMCVSHACADVFLFTLRGLAVRPPHRRAVVVHLSLREGGFENRFLLVARLSALPPRCKLVSLAIYGPDGPLDWSRILARPCIQHLQSLTLTGRIDIGADHVRALAALPRLATLRVEGTAVAPADFAAFAASPTLTSLFCSDLNFLLPSPVSVIPFVLASPSLVRLSVVKQRYAFIGCSPLFALPGMERIPELTLGDGRGRRVCVAGAARGRIRFPRGAARSSLAHHPIVLPYQSVSTAPAARPDAALAEHRD